MTPRNRLMLRQIRKDIRAVSEVVGSVMLLLMTVTVFSGIIIFVNSIQGPGNQTFVDLIPGIDRTDANNGVVMITHAGGQPLDASTTAIIVVVNSTRYQLAVADGLTPTDGRWSTGQRWQVPFGANTLSQNATVQVTVIDLNVNQIVLLALVQRGVGTGGTFPIIGNSVVIPDGFVYNSGAHPFRVRVIGVDYDNDLPKNGVTVALGALGCGLVNQTLQDTGFGVYESVSATVIPTCLPVGTYYVNVTATDLAGHMSRATLALEIRSLAVVSPPSSGTGPFGWSFNNRFQAFEIYNATEWDSKRFNGTGTRDFVKGEVVVVVVASQFLKNIDLQNDLMLSSPIGLPIKPITYSGAAPGPTTVPSSNAAFRFDEFIAGYFLYSARFNTDSAAYGFNGTQLAVGQYNLDITLRTSNLPPPDNRFDTTALINVTDSSGGIPFYPRMQFYKDKNLTQPSNVFNFTEQMFVKVTVATTDATAAFGALTIADYQGGIQIFAPPGNPPVSAYSIKNATIYSFLVDLSSPNRDAWVFEANAYGVSLSTVIDADEKYALSGQVIINGPKWAADVISAMREWRNTRGNDRVYSVFYDHDNSGNWQETFVASYISGGGGTPRWAGRDMLDVVFADMDGDGSLDAVEGSSSGFVMLFRNKDGTGHDWDNYVIDNFGGPDVISVAAGHIDADPFNDVVAGTNNGQIWYYKNDGSWLPLICDRLQGRRTCDITQNEKSSPVLVASVGATVLVQDLKLADMNGDGTNDLVAGLSNNLIRVFFNDGFGSFGNTVTTDYTMSADSAVQGTVTNTYTATQSSNNVWESIREVNGTGQNVIGYSPVAEFISAYGQIETGSFANTFALDGAPYEVLTESYASTKWMIRNSTSGGSPGHQYAFGSIPSISGSDYATVTIGGFLSTGTEPMEVRYKVGSGAASAVLGTISETSMAVKTFALTGFTGGELYIVVQDSDISNNDASTDAKQTKVSLDLVEVDVMRANGTTSRLEHKWQSASVGTAGAAYRLFVEANHTMNNESDDFLFEWGPASTGPWSPVAVVSKTADDNGLLSALLPTSVGGTQIWVRVTDTNRTANGTSLDTVSIDNLFVRRYTSVPNTLNITTSAGIRELVIADTNANGHNDIIAARGSGGVIYYGPSFATSTDLPTPRPALGIDVGHIDENGQLDVVIGEDSQYVHVFYNNNNTYTRVQFVDLSAVINSVTNFIRVGDLDGDGHDDIVIATRDGDILLYRHLQGAGWEFIYVDNLRRSINTIDIGDADRGITFDYSGKL